LDDYQARCGDTANYPEAGTGSITAITYCVLGLAGEAGEVADKWKKVLRGDHGDGEVPQEIKDLMVKEVGDTTWYAARLSIELGVSLSKVAQGNLDKLASRKERGVIKGSGDLR
jgi:NTP pyrophosphatase (non-canonical NTP hydrolase)